MATTETAAAPSRRVVKLVGGVVLVGAALAGVGYYLGYDTFATWAQLASSLVTAIAG